MNESLRQELPPVFNGYPTHFGAPDKEGVRRMEAVDGGPVILESPTACQRLQYLYVDDRNNELDIGENEPKSTYFSGFFTGFWQHSNKRDDLSIVSVNMRNMTESQEHQ